MSQKITDPNRANRLARVLFSDVALYAGDQVRIGLEKDDLFDRLASEIQRAWSFYRDRVDPSVPHFERMFNTSNGKSEERKPPSGRADVCRISIDNEPFAHVLHAPLKIRVNLQPGKLATQ